MIRLTDRPERCDNMTFRPFGFALLSPWQELVNVTKLAPEDLYNLPWTINKQKPQRCFCLTCTVHILHTCIPTVLLFIIIPRLAIIYITIPVTHCKHFSWFLVWQSHVNPHLWCFLLAEWRRTAKGAAIGIWWVHSIGIFSKQTSFASGRWITLFP